MQTERNFMSEKDKGSQKPRRDGGKPEQRETKSTSPAGPTKTKPAPDINEPDRFDGERTGGR
jgi:hypothetical protein